MQVQKFDISADLHQNAKFNKCKNIFTKMLKDVGIEVPKTRETRSKCSMHGMIACNNHNMRNPLLVFTDVGIWGYACYD